MRCVGCDEWVSVGIVCGVWYVVNKGYFVNVWMKRWWFSTDAASPYVPLAGNEEH